MYAHRSTSPVFAGCLALALAYSASQGRPFGSGSDQDYGIASTQYADIPVPSGMKLIDDPKVSHSSEAGSWRFGDFAYEGSASLADAGNYMMSRMPKHDWKLVSEEVPTPNSRVLRFERGIYSAECRLVRESATTRMEVKYRTLPTTK